MEPDSITLTLVLLPTLTERKGTTYHSTPLTGEPTSEAEVILEVLPEAGHQAGTHQEDPETVQEATQLEDSGVHHQAGTHPDGGTDIHQEETQEEEEAVEEEEAHQFHHRQHQQGHRGIVQVFGQSSAARTTKYTRIRQISQRG
jgi:hypothetical protein